MSRILEALFDELEYRLAKRELRHAGKIKSEKRARTKVLTDQVAVSHGSVLLKGPSR